MIDGALDRILASIDKLRSKIAETPPLEVLEIIQSLWNPYSPQEKDRCLAGVDSGYNYDEISGFIVYIANAGALSSCRGMVYSNAKADIYFPQHEPEKDLTALSIDMEVEAVRQAARTSRESYILVDGSIVSKLAFLVKYSASRSGGLGVDPEKTIEEIVRLAKSMGGKIVFISKSSSSRELFKRHIDIGEAFIKPDIFYLNKYTSEPGYSKPERYTDSDHEGGGVVPHIIHVRKRHQAEDLNIYFTYIRIEPNTPVYRVEVPLIGELEDPNQYFRELIDTLSAGSLSGYPIVLREIDRLVRVGREDIEKLKLMLGLEGTSQQIYPPKVM